MVLYIHTLSSQAHLEDLRDRLIRLAQASSLDLHTAREDARVERLVAVVRAMDRGDISPATALEVFGRESVPGFSFGRWLVEMVDEGVYLEAVFDEVA